jgi:hypothetical protein
MVTQRLLTIHQGDAESLCCTIPSLENGPT